MEVNLKITRNVSSVVVTVKVYRNMFQPIWLGKMLHFLIAPKHRLYTHDLNNYIPLFVKLFIRWVKSQFLIDLGWWWAGLGGYSWLGWCRVWRRRNFQGYSSVYW